MFQKVSGIEKFKDKKGIGGWEYYDFLSNLFLSHRAQKFRRETLYGVTNFGCRKIVCFRGLCHDFPSKNLFLTVPKHFVKEPFCAVFQKNSGCEKVNG